jgi:HlyD family secretion protein
MKARWLRPVVVLLVLGALIVGLRRTVFAPEPVPVTVYEAARGRVEETVTNSKAGTVRSRLRAEISPEIGARVAALPVTEGESVEKGALLLRLADEDYRARVELEQRSLEAARASARQACREAEHAELELERLQRLVKDQVVSRDQVDRARSQRDVTAAACEAARARIAQAEAALRQAQVQLSRTVITAPFAGVVAEVRTEVGEWITPSPTGVPVPPVIEMFTPSETYVSAPLDEVHLGKVRVGLPVRITMDAYPDEEMSGRVERMAPYVIDVQDQNRTFEVEVAFDAEREARTIPPGTSADVEVILDVREGVLRVPSYAIIRGERVLVVREGTLESVEIEQGLSNWEFSEITDGLEAGDLVVVSLDREEVKAGAQVTVEERVDR